MSVNARQVIDAVRAIVITGTVAMAAVTLLSIATRIELGGHFSWYAARAAGMVAYLLATASVILGLATSSRLGGRIVGKGSIADIHRVLSLLTLFAICGHLLFLALDQYAAFTSSDLLVPFIGWYRPVWSGLGIIAAYLAVGVYFSFYLRPLIGYKTWRAFHYAAFGVFVLATLHGLLAGTDTGAVWALALYGAGTASVVTLLLYRIAGRPSEGRKSIIVHSLRIENRPVVTTMD